MARYYLTEKGYKALAAEVEELDRLLKNDIAKQIATAAEHGDLKENAEYHAAKERQVHVSNRLRQLQERLEGANVVRKDELLPVDKVTFGKRIRIRDTEGNERVCTILGEGEADPDKGIIGYQSPLARALIGHMLGEKVDVQLPRAVRTYEILEVDFYEGFKD